MQTPISEIAISVPFTIGPTGTVVQTSDQSKIWEDRVRSVVATSIGERVMRYTYGSTLYQEVFDNETNVNEQIRGIIFEAFTKHIKVLELENVTSSFDQSTGSATIGIFYRLPNNELKTLTINSVSAQNDVYTQGTFTLRGNLQPIEGK